MKSARGDVSMTVKGILFDLDDTLLVEVASATFAFEQACRLALDKTGAPLDLLVATAREKARALWHQGPARAYCVRIGVSSWEGLWARFEGDDPDLKTMREWAPIYRFQTWTMTLFAHNVRDEELASRMSETYFSERRRRHLLFEDSLNALRYAHGRFRMGLITNGLSCLQREKIKGAGQLEKYFDTIVISGDVGIAKPAPPMFDTALANLELAPEQVVMVGNGMRTDIEGAKAAGLRAIYIDRGDPHGGDSSSIPEATIHNLNELDSVLRRFEDLDRLGDEN